MNTFEDKNYKSLVTLIFDKIRDDILNNTYSIGEKLIEAKLADDFGVSRTPVREALKQLELDGIIDNIPNRGMIVKGISSQDIKDIYVLRKQIEGIAAMWAVERMDENLIDELKEIYDLMEFYAFKEDYDKLLALSTRFHETIYNATQSRYLEQILRDYQLYIKISRSNSLRCSGRVNEALLEYKEILEGFINKDAERTRQAMIKHIEHIRE